MLGITQVFAENDRASVPLWATPSGSATAGHINVGYALGDSGEPPSPALTGEVILSWTASGDDSLTGTAFGYDVRYRSDSLGPILTLANFIMSRQVLGEPPPSPSGSRDSMIVTGLVPGAGYYFCMVVFDENYNVSRLSSSPHVIAGASDFLPGDANGDGFVRGSDVLYLLAYFRGINPPPQPYYAGDANGDCIVGPADLTYLTNYLKGFGAAPVSGNCLPLLIGKIGESSR